MVNIKVVSVGYLLCGELCVGCVLYDVVSEIVGMLLLGEVYVDFWLM